MLLGLILIFLLMWMVSVYTRSTLYEWINEALGGQPKGFYDKWRPSFIESEKTLESTWIYAVPKGVNIEEHAKRRLEIEAMSKDPVKKAKWERDSLYAEQKFQHWLKTTPRY
jgi:hypothetical protein